ncbi:MAG: chromate transporter [Alphaproteobacteria bacterium]|nr:chromate transporter [Alphaproteobacteria bacterium]
MDILIKLFCSFFKIGLFTFGGGYAILPLLKSEVVEKQKWLTEDELLDYFSIGQCTPGIIAVNVATFSGYKLKGIIGAILTTFGIICPSIIIICLIASLLNLYIDNQTVEHALAGIRIGVCALISVLIFDMAKKIYKQSRHKKLHFSIFLLSLMLLLLTDVSAVLTVISASVIGFLPKLLKRGQK